jgi:hypothetical protein
MGHGHCGAVVNVARIKTGEGGGIFERRPLGLLAPAEPELIGPGEQYHMDAPELHESIPSRGCVSVISRKFYTTREDQFATVCWREGDWISAEPRPATRAEIEHFVSLAVSL